MTCHQLQCDAAKREPAAGVGCHTDKARGGHEGQEARGSSGRHLSREEEEERIWERKETGGGPRRVDPLSYSFEETDLSQSISFQQLIASFLRLTLKSRTRFAAFLARTFFLTFSGFEPCTTVFPLPLPEFGLFEKQRCPRLGVKKWSSLCRKRLLHVLVVFLNYQYNGLKPVLLSELRRSPSLAQLKVFQHLRGLIAVSDRAGDHPIPPGRSGPEFVARLIELSTYVNENKIFDPGSYYESVGFDVEKVGMIHQRFSPSTEFSPVLPYRSLDASRLKLSGTGTWPLGNYLDGSILWLPFVEPLVLRHGGECSWPGPSFARETIEENFELAKLWSLKGLMALFEKPAAYSSRVFNTYKNAEVDRQIGDRRFMNGGEYHPRGPSADLPSGVSMTSVHCPRGMKLVGCASDRKDFYHQAQVTRSRASTNMLPFAFPESWFQGFDELDVLYRELREPTSREKHGDQLGRGRTPLLVSQCLDFVYVGFKSLFQGDHLGVEYALQSHSSLLEWGGLLSEGRVIKRNHAFPVGPTWEGLVIDDYFTLSTEKVSTDPLRARSVELLEIAEEIYQKAGVLGSDDKTIRGSCELKAVGAEVLSNAKVLGAGLSAVGAPLGKRIALASLSLRLAALPVISRGIASRLAGNWTSVLMFRRCLTCILDGIFQLGNTSAATADEVITLPRSIAEELVLASIASFLAITDVSVPYDTKVYATDASTWGGAVVQTVVEEEVAKRLWLGGDRKGAYTQLEHGASAALRILGEETEAERGLGVPFQSFHPKRALDFCFDFVEICGGSGVLSEAMAERGFRVCTPIDLSQSPAFDLGSEKLLDWIFQMIAEKRFRSLALEPPCTTFSPAQYPASRSYDNPLGFDRKEKKTYLGNLLAFRCLTIAWFAWRFDLPLLLEQPRLSKMAWLGAWRHLLSLGFEEAILASCMLGSIHKKEFRLLVYGLDTDRLTVRCSGGHRHVRIEGKYTKASAIYAPGVAKLIADCFSKALSEKIGQEDPSVSGLESVIINDILLSRTWTTTSVWAWKHLGHINVLESHAYVALLNALAKRGGSLRFNAFLDSRVAKGAHGKGRSSARSLKRSLKKASALTIAGNLHPSFGFAPTTLNTAEIFLRLLHILFWIIFALRRLQPFMPCSSRRRHPVGFGLSCWLPFAFLLLEHAQRLLPWIFLVGLPSSRGLSSWTSCPYLGPSLDFVHLCQLAASSCSPCWHRLSVLRTVEGIRLLPFWPFSSSSAFRQSLDTYEGGPARVVGAVLPL